MAGESRNSQVMGTPPGRNLFENGSRNGKFEREILEGSQLVERRTHLPVLPCPLGQPQVPPRPPRGG